MEGGSAGNTKTLTLKKKINLTDKWKQGKKPKTWRFINSAISRGLITQHEKYWILAGVKRAHWCDSFCYCYPVVVWLLHVSVYNGIGEPVGNNKLAFVNTHIMLVWCFVDRVIRIPPGLRWYLWAQQAGVCVTVYIMASAGPGAWQRCYPSRRRYAGTQVAGGDPGFHTAGAPGELLLQLGLHTPHNDTHRGRELMDAYTRADYVNCWQFKSYRSGGMY